MQPGSRCYLCGTVLIEKPEEVKRRPPDNLRTRDHVPPKGIFTDPKPSNLLTVDCCRKCNNQHSDFDEQIRIATALEIGRNAGGQKILLERVFGSTFRNRRQPEFVAQLVHSIRPEVIPTPDGPEEVAVLNVPRHTILEGVKAITKGLLATFYPSFDYFGHAFEVIDIHSATLAKGQRDRQLRAIREMVNKTEEDSRGILNEFRFWRKVDLGNQRGAWLLLFFESTFFFVIHDRVDPFGSVRGQQR